MTLGTEDAKKAGLRRRLAVQARRREFEANPTFSTHRGNCYFFEGRGLQGRVNTTETISNPL
jgi:hypothetical protein